MTIRKSIINGTLCSFLWVLIAFVIQWIFNPLISYTYLFVGLPIILFVVSLIHSKIRKSRSVFFAVILINSVILLTGYQSLVSHIFLNKKPIQTEIKNEIQKDIEIQLDQMYSDRFVIKDIYLLIGGFMQPKDREQYYVEIYPERKKSFSKKLEINNDQGKWAISNIDTTVDFALFNDDLNDEWKSKIREFFGNTSYKLYAVRDIRPAYDSSGKLMNYKTYLQKYPNKMHLNFNFNRQQEELNDNEYKKILKFINFLQDNQIKIQGITISYPQSTMIIREDQMANIKTIDDLKQRVLPHSR